MIMNSCLGLLFCKLAIKKNQCKLVTLVDLSQKAIFKTSFEIYLVVIQIFTFLGLMGLHRDFLICKEDVKVK